MKTLVDILHDADAIEIDDFFIRYFSFYPDEGEHSDDTIFDAAFTDEDGNMYEWFFTREELETAKFVPETNEWLVYQAGEKEPYSITTYRIETIGIDGE